MTTKTIMLANLPAQLADILAALLRGQSDLAPISAPVQGDLIAASAAAKAPVLLVANDDPTNLAAIDPKLGWAADLSILAITADGRSACIHRIRSQTQVLDGVSVQTIVDALVGLAAEHPQR